MSKQIIANCIIETFQEYPMKEQLLMVQNSKTVEDKIIKSLDKRNSMS